MPGGQYLLRLAHDLLDFAQLGQQPIKKQAVNVGTLVQEILQQLRQAAPHHNVDLRLGALPDALADPSLLRQVFVNLLSNAFKFTRRVSHPVIEIDGYSQPGHCTYSVRDNGVGFDIATARHLSSIFDRLNSEKDFEGTGVGLSIVQRIIECHGGRIAADAEAGKGAKFTFTLAVCAYRGGDRESPQA